MADRRRTGDHLDEDSRAASRTSARASASDPDPDPDPDSDPERERRLRRARFLADLAEARELRKRVTPRRTRAAELHARVLRTFRY